MIKLYSQEVEFVNAPLQYNHLCAMIKQANRENGE